MSFESTLAGYVLCIGLPLMLATAVLLSVVRNAPARKILFIVFAALYGLFIVWVVAWSLESWPAWFLTVPMVGLGVWALGHGFRRTFGAQHDA